MKNWYGWIIEQSLDNLSVFKKYLTLKMKSEEDDWKEHIIEIPETEIANIVFWLERHLKDSWYAHLVKDNKLIVIYKNKNFKLNIDSSFNEVTEYGRSQHIPEKQLPAVSLFDLARESGY